MIILFHRIYVFLLFFIIFIKQLYNICYWHLYVEYLFFIIIIIWTSPYDLWLHYFSICFFINPQRFLTTFQFIIIYFLSYKLEEDWKLLNLLIQHLVVNYHPVVSYLWMFILIQFVVDVFNFIPHIIVFLIEYIKFYFDLSLVLVIVIQRLTFPFYI